MVPYVIVYFESNKAPDPSIDFVVKNIGSTPAFDITLQINPPMARANEIDGHSLMGAKAIAEGMSMLAPQQEFQTFFEEAGERNGRTFQAHLK